jgi:hypothetical protein
MSKSYLGTDNLARQRHFTAQIPKYRTFQLVTMVTHNGVANAFGHGIRQNPDILRRQPLDKIAW